MSELLTDAELTGIRARVSHQHRPGNQRPTPLATTIDLERLISHTNAQAAEIRGLRAAYDRVCIELAEITQAYVDKTTQAYDLQQDLARLRAANAAAEKEIKQLRDGLHQYGRHRPSCSADDQRRREGLLVGALESIVLSDLPEDLKVIARNALEYCDSMAEAQRHHTVCSCNWDEARALLGDGGEKNSHDHSR